MRFLITAFRPYDRWVENSSWLSLQRWLRDYQGDHQLITRLYPVDLAEVKQRLQADLEHQPEAVLHLGQAPGAPAIAVEEIALNVAGTVEQTGRSLPQLLPDGPIAYRTSLDAHGIVTAIRAAGVPAHVSYHAGTYLCNAVFYLSHYFLQRRGQVIPVAFLHLPLATEQLVDAHDIRLPSLPVDVLAKALDAAIAEISTQRITASHFDSV